MGCEICGNYIQSLWNGELLLAEQARLSILITDKSFLFITNHSITFHSVQCCNPLITSSAFQCHVPKYSPHHSLICH